MKIYILLLSILTTLNFACSNTLEDSIYNKKSDPRIDDPKIGSAVPAQESIIVRDIESDFCVNYHVYYKKVFSGINQDEILSQNVSLWNVAANIDNNCADEIIISNLEYDQLYVIAVIGVDSFGNKSKPVFYTDKENRGNIVFIKPLPPASGSAAIINIKNASAGDHSINITGITSNLSSGYKYYIYFREINANDNLSLVIYEQFENWNLGAVITNSGYDSAIIENVESNKNYIIKIIGINNNKDQTPPFFWKGADNNGYPEILNPKTLTRPEKIQNIYLNLADDRCSIIVSNIKAKDMYQYEIEWREVIGDGVWQRSGIKNSVSANEALQYKINQTEYWERYEVRVRGYNADAPNGQQYGEYSDVLTIETDFVDRNFEASMEWVDITLNVADNETYEKYFQGSTEISIINIPLNTTAYQIKIIEENYYLRLKNNFTHNDIEILNHGSLEINENRDFTELYKTINFRKNLSQTFFNKLNKFSETSHAEIKFKLLIKNKYGDRYETDPISIESLGSF